jgi:ABC-type sugar transport system permease subunit
MAKAAQRSGARMASPATMMMVRQWHTYIGAFIAPSVLFFAFTGSLQLFSLHEAHGSYTPPPIVEALSRVHKDQVLREKPAAKGGDAGDEHDHDGGHHHHHAGAAEGPPTSPPWSVTALKWLFLAVAIGLITSTLLGLWMALTLSRRKAVVLALFAAGVVLPVLLVVL